MSKKYPFFRITIALLITSGFGLAFVWKSGGAWMGPRSSANSLAVGAALSDDQIRRGIDARSLLAPVLGTYPNTSVEAGGNVIVTSSAAPSGTTRINASANTNFKGTLVANPTTGVVRVTNAHPAGTYVVTVRAFDGVGGVASGTFTLTVGNQSVCEPIQFTSAANVSTTGGGNLRVSVGDFNNDGNQDLAATNSTSGTVSVRLGNGSGGFSGSTEVGVGSGALGITVGDFNNDGNQDIATANGGTNTLSVRLGNGTGGFSGTTTLTVQDSPQIVVTADFNKDGNHDLAVTGLRDGAVSSVFVLLGNGTGGFGAPNDLFVGAGGNSGAFGLAPGDFNNNGNPDVAVANTLRDPGIVSLRLGDGLGGFGGFFEVTSIGLGNSIPRDIAIGDFNNDGNQDFATTSRRGVSGTGAQTTVSVRLGNGAAGFTGSTELDVASTGNLLGVATADFNKDGKQDIVTTGVSGGSSAAFVRVGNGSGGFSGTFMTQVGNGADGVAIGDFNNDGRQDFVTATTENFLSVRLGSCTLGTGPSPTPTPAPVNPQPAILTTTETTNRIVVFPNAYTPDVQNLVPGLPAGARPFAVSFFDPDHALVSDFDGHRIFVVRISTASIVSTVEMSVTTPDPLTRYDGTGTLVVAPDRTRALAIGEDNLLHVINAPFDSNSVVTDLCLPGFVSSNATQAIAFDNAGRAFVHHSEGITVLDPPYSSAAFTIPLPGGTGDSGIVISQDGNTLLTTIGLGSVAGNVARIFQAPFSAASTPTTLSIPNSFGASGIRIAPDGASAILLNFGRRQAFAVFAPFSVNSLVEEIPLPPGENLGFGDLDISADSKISILTRSGAQPANQAVSIRAPFGTASVSASVPVAGVVNPSSGFGSVRFMPRGLAAGLTVSGTAAPSVASGTNLTYTLSYRNSGIVNASNVVIRNPIPAGTTFVSATNGGSLAGDRVVFNVGNLSANSATQTVSFTVNVTPLGSSPITNSNYTIEGTGVAALPGPPIATSVTGLAPAPTPCAPVIFQNTAPIVIPDEGPAGPYPSAITASGLSGTVTKVTATLKNINHMFGTEVDVLLVGPGGQRLLLMSDAGGPLNGLTYTFDDDATLCLTQFGTRASGMYQPSNEFQNDVFPAPAPPGPYFDPQSLSVFNGTNPNGNWSLYAFDDSPSDGGSIGLGWELSITTNVCSALPVNISGRVFTSTGIPLRNAVVSLIDQTGGRRTATTSSFGVYSFGNVNPGETYTITVASKRFRFAPRVMQINDTVTNLDFIGLE